MIYKSHIELPIKKRDERFIFLAGSMDHMQKASWRNEIIGKFGNNNIFDPTNHNHDSLNAEQMENHIKWELDALELSDIILLNFLPDALSPISLVELGLYVKSNKLVVICPQKFYKSTYVQTLCKTYNTPVFNTIEEAKKTLNNSI